MENWSEIKTDDNHAEELAVIVHEGREYPAGGFSIDMESGRMIAYVVENEYGQVWLTTWGGERIARLHESGKSRGFYGVELRHFKTTEPVAGYYWFGKGLGVGMMLRLKRGGKA